MPNLREEITKRFLRLTGGAVSRPPSEADEQSYRPAEPFSPRPATKSGASSPSSPEFAETILQSDSREGQQFGGYRILKRIGYGGMGHVYLAVDTRLGRQVALKFLPPDLTSNPDLLHRLQQE